MARKILNHFTVSLFSVTQFASSYFLTAPPVSCFYYFLSQLLQFSQKNLVMNLQILAQMWHWLALCRVTLYPRWNGSGWMAPHFSLGRLQLVPSVNSEQAPCPLRVGWQIIVYNKRERNMQGTCTMFISLLNAGHLRCYIPAQTYTWIVSRPLGSDQVYMNKYLTYLKRGALECLVSALKFL